MIHVCRNIYMGVSYKYVHLSILKRKLNLVSYNFRRTGFYEASLKVAHRSVNKLAINIDVS